ncbi:carbamoyltransferase N-terminal domain-containing protein [Sorangium sp. So ce341]|uniref:carbamoyltransferase N-terminal domain-containing protein n=1 Tax=Sorangium sp. So ce341 TaxID=3133302 RepID=UPI003F602E86
MFLLAQQTHRMLVSYHPRIGHLYVPNQKARIPHERGGYLVRTNAQGFRSDVDYAPQRQGKPRILVFGDSMTAGDGCENHERYTEHLGRLLSAEVYNYGLSGSGTDQQTLILEELAAGVDADLIVLAVYIDNVERVLSTHRVSIDSATGRKLLVPKPYFELVDGELAVRQQPVPRDRPDAGLAWEHHFPSMPGLAMLYSQLRGVPVEPANMTPITRAASDVMERLQGQPLFDQLVRFAAPRSWDDIRPFRPWIQRMLGFRPCSAHYDEPTSDGSRLLRAIIARFVEAARPRPVLLMPIPVRYYCQIPSAASYQAFFADTARDLGCEHLDLLGELARLPFDERKRISFPIDPHFSPEGHEQVARVLARHIQDRGLLPARSANAPASSAKAAGGVVAQPRHARPREKYILGISCFYHDSAACIVRDGEVVAAAEEERFSRVKNDRGFPRQAINFCLEEANVALTDLAAIAYYDDSALAFERVLSSAAAAGRSAREQWAAMLPSWLSTKLRIAEVLEHELAYRGLVLENLHHRSHAASAFFPSPFEEAAILTIDGVGEWSTASIGVGRGSELRLLQEMRFPHSLGLLYSAFTQFTGFKVNSGEYKMMGLAPYGEPRYVDRILQNLVEIRDDGSIRLNLEYFTFFGEDTITNARFAALFEGPARDPAARITRREMDLARSVQVVIEEAVLKMAAHARRLTSASKLCMAGGVALNCVANGRILREGPFDEIWIQPAAGDAGGALGAALDAYHSYFGQPRRPASSPGSAQRGSYLGPAFSSSEVEAFVQTHGLPCERLEPSSRAARVAELLASGRVVGHFSGRAEFGPRALGARSILGDARSGEMQVTLNRKIKYRESFRPFAPSVLAERAREYFECAGESPFMLLVAPLVEDKRKPFSRGSSEDLLEVVRAPRSDVPAVTHVDYSARVQTVTREAHPAYRAVIDAFAEKTGCPVIVNTSFNVRGEPIVNTPYDAYRCFMRTDMDALFIEDHLFLKEQQPPWPEKGGAYDEWASVGAPAPEQLTRPLERLFDRDFLPALADIAGGLATAGAATRSPADGRWERLDAATTYPRVLERRPAQPDAFGRAITGRWSSPELARALAPVIAKGVRIVGRVPHRAQREVVSDTMYVMF